MTAFRLVPCDAAGVPTETLPLSPDLEQACAGSAELYARIGFQPPWISYVSVAGKEGVGGCAFVGAPQNNRVEIAYFTLPHCEGRGFASRAAAALVAIARATAPEVTVFAKTLPQQNASTAILKRLEFAHVGEVTDDEIGAAWLWELAR